MNNRRANVGDLLRELQLQQDRDDIIAMRILDILIKAAYPIAQQEVLRDPIGRDAVRIIAIPRFQLPSGKMRERIIDYYKYSSTPLYYLDENFDTWEILDNWRDWQEYTTLGAAIPTHLSEDEQQGGYEIDPQAQKNRRANDDM